VSRADRDPGRRPDDRAVHDPDKLSGRGCDDLHRPPAGRGSNPDARGDLPPPTAGSAGISSHGGWPAEVTPPATRPADTSLPHPWALDLPPTPATGTADHRSPHPWPPRGRPSAAAESADASPEAAWSARVLRPGAWLDGPSASAWPGGLVGGGDAGQGDLAVPGGDDVDGVGAVAAGRWDRGGPVGAAAVRRPWARGASPRLRPGWYGYRPTAGAELPAWAAEIAFTIERPVDGELQALALLRAPARVGWLAGMVETFAEVEVAAVCGQPRALARWRVPDRAVARACCRVRGCLGWCPSRPRTRKRVWPLPGREDFPLRCDVGGRRRAARRCRGDRGLDRS
jgi:hypothetical protein